MSCEYREAYEESLAESVYTITDHLSENALRRLLEEMLIEDAIDKPDFAWTLMHQTKKFIADQEKAVAGYIEATP
jgi:hypothetical protein